MQGDRLRRGGGALRELDDGPVVGRAAAEMEASRGSREPDLRASLAERELLRGAPVAGREQHRRHDLGTAARHVDAEGLVERAELACGSPLEELAELVFAT